MINKILTWLGIGSAGLALHCVIYASTWLVLAGIFSVTCPMPLLGLTEAWVFMLATIHSCWACIPIEMGTWIVILKLVNRDVKKHERP